MKKRKRKVDCIWQEVAEKALIQIDQEIRECKNMTVPPPEETGIHMLFQKLYTLMQIRRSIIIEETKRRKSERHIPTSVPRDVLIAALEYKKIPLPDGRLPPKEVCVFRVWRLMESKSSNRCCIAVSILAGHHWPEFVRIGTIPWRREMGA